MRILVLGLGNELAGDDAAGLLAVRLLRDDLAPGVEVAESSLSGLGLIECFIGYDRAVVVDAVLTGAHSPGTITEMSMADVGRVRAPSLHQAGIPEMAATAAWLGVQFPSEVRVLAVEVEDPHTIGAPVSETVSAALEPLAHRVREIIARWPTDEPPAASGSHELSAAPVGGKNPALDGITPMEATHA